MTTKAYPTNHTNNWINLSFNFVKCGFILEKKREALKKAGDILGISRAETAFH